MVFRNRDAVGVGLSGVSFSFVSGNNNASMHLG